MAAASDHIVALRERKENLESAAYEARAVLAERRQYLDSADTIAAELVSSIRVECQALFLTIWDYRLSGL